MPLSRSRRFSSLMFSALCVRLRRGPYELHRIYQDEVLVLNTQDYSRMNSADSMGQAMVAIVQKDCTGCDLCIYHCPFEALLPLEENPAGRTHPKRPVVVVENRCVGCLSCIGSCPTDALHEVQIPPNAPLSPLLQSGESPKTETIIRWKKRSTRWA